MHYAEKILTAQLSFLQLDPPSTPRIRRENVDFRQHFLYRTNFKTLALRFNADGKHYSFEKEAFQE